MLACLMAFASLLVFSSPNALGKVGESQLKNKQSQVSGKPGKESKSNIIVLGDKLATIELPSEYVFIGPKEAAEVVKRQGSNADGILGVIALREPSENDYCVMCYFDEVGYVDDEDADQLNTDDLLDAFKDVAKANNEERKKLNLAPMFVTGWAQQPYCKKEAHQLVWAIKIKTDYSAKSSLETINYNTRVLGRRGVLSMNLVTAPEFFEQNKPKMAALLNATKFCSGQSYGDFKPGSDKLAEFGIAGLILGGGAVAAAAKCGVLALLWKWLLVPLLLLKKFLVFLIIGAGSLFPRLMVKWKKRKISQSIISVD